MSVEPVRLETPLEARDLEPLRSGDVVRLYGVLYTARYGTVTVNPGDLLTLDPARYPGKK